MPDLAHEVFNRPEPLVDDNRFEGKRALRDALSRAYDPARKPWHHKAGLTMGMGMGMTEEQGGSDVRAYTTEAVADGRDAAGLAQGTDFDAIITRACRADAPGTSKGKTCPT